MTLLRKPSFLLYFSSIGSTGFLIDEENERHTHMRMDCDGGVREVFLQTVRDENFGNKEGGSKFFSSINQ